MSDFLPLRSAAPHHYQAYKMVTTRSNTKANTAQTPEVANTGFRLGDDNQSDGSDSDQSVHSTRSLSPSKKGSNATRSKKRRVLKEERKKVGALTEDLDTLLGAAFQAPVEDVEITATGTCSISHVA
jgi:hypothetical protein